MSARAAGLAVLVLLASCRIGPRAQNFKPAIQPMGVTATVTTPSQTISGELLELRDSAVVLLSTQLILVPDRLIDRATFSDTRIELSRRYPMRAEERTQLRLLGRYPYGMPEGVIAKLLASRGQATLVVIEK